MAKVYTVVVAGMITCELASIGLIVSLQSTMLSFLLKLACPLLKLTPIIFKQASSIKKRYQNKKRTMLSSIFDLV